MLGPSKTLLAAIGLRSQRPRRRPRPHRRPPAASGSSRRLLFWRLTALLRVHGQSDTDPLSGFLEQRAFARHVAGVVQAASSGRPALLIAVDLDDFGRWNAQHGYGAGDALLSDLAARLEGSDLSGRRLEPPRRRPLRLDRHRPRVRRAAATSPRRSRRSPPATPASSPPAPPSWCSPTTPRTPPTPSPPPRRASPPPAPATAEVVAFDRGRLDGVEYSAGLHGLARPAPRGDPRAS